VILASGERITGAEVVEALPAVRQAGAGSAGMEGKPLREIMAEVERAVVRRSLERNRWKMSAAARELDLERSHLYKKVKTLGIQKPDDSPR